MYEIVELNHKMQPYNLFVIYMYLYNVMSSPHGAVYIMDFSIAVVVPMHFDFIQLLLGKLERAEKAGAVDEASKIKTVSCSFSWLFPANN